MEKETNPLLEPNVANDKSPEQYERSCPKCAKRLQITIGYPTWCPDCNWNLEPEEPEILQWMKAQQKQDPFEKLYEAIRQNRKDKIAAPTVISSGNYKVTADTFAVYFIALLINSLLLSPIVAFIWFLQQEPTWVTAVFKTLPFLGFSFWLWPDFGPVPDEYLPLKKYPALYNIVNKVARSLNAPQINRIVIDSIFNAAYSVRGLRRIPVLMLGWPYLAVFNRQERLALLGHELAHAVNSDPSRNIFVVIAIHMLSQMYKLFWLLRNWGFSIIFWLVLFFVTGLFAVELFPANMLRIMIFAVVSGIVITLIPLLGVFGLRYFLWRERYRAEFRADWFSAQVAGTEAAVSSLQKSGWWDAVALAINHHYRQMIKTKHYQDLIFLLQKHIEDAPNLERERIKRVKAKQEQIVSDTHPGTAVRLATLEANPVYTPSVTITEEEWQAFEKELDELMIEIQKKWYISYLRVRSGAPA